jgi:hypothetical protein
MILSDIFEIWMGYKKKVSFDKKKLAWLVQLVHKAKTKSGAKKK